MIIHAETPVQQNTNINSSPSSIKLQGEKNQEDIDIIYDEGIDNNHKITFDFDVWLSQNGLEEIKNIFVDHQMNTLQSLTFKNLNYAKLITDRRIKQLQDNTAMVKTIGQSIHKLEESQISKKLEKQKIKRETSNMEIVYEDSIKNDEDLNETKNVLVDHKMADKQISNSPAKSMPIHNLKDSQIVSQTCKQSVNSVNITNTDDNQSNLNIFIEDSTDEENENRNVIETNVDVASFQNNMSISD